jgi:hypothetical protein
MFWNVRAQDSGFVIWVDGQTPEQHMKAKNISELLRQLSDNNGFTDELRGEVMVQLSEGTMARVEVP